MKVTDYRIISEEISDQLDKVSWSILEYIPRDVCVLLVANIYMMNDLYKGFGQDIPEVLSVISSRHRISVISQGHSSFYKTDNPICNYELLWEDIFTILTTLQAAIDRMEYNAE